MLKSEQSEQGVDFNKKFNTSTKICSKNKLWTRVFTHHGIVYDISEKVTSVITNVCVYKNGGFLDTFIDT